MKDLALIRIFFYCVVFLVLGALHMIGSIAADILLKKKVFSNLEPEGQGRGIIMGMTHLHLLGPFYYIALYWGV